MPRTGRAYWKGHLRLSLVSIPVEIFNAVDTSSDITFNQIHKPSGKRINYTKTVKGIGPIEAGDIVKGYAVDKNIYVTLEPDELEALKVESKKTLDLTDFVDASAIDMRYFERPYYVLPADEMAAEGYLVIREALKRMNKVGIGQVTVAGREYLVGIAPVGDGLCLEILRYATELRPAEDYFRELPELEVDEDMVSLAAELIGRKSSDFQPEKYRNRYVDAVKALVEEKMKGRTIVAADEPEPASAKVIDLMEALKKSVAGDSKPSKSKSSVVKTPSKAPKKRASARK